MILKFHSFSLCDFLITNGILFDMDSNGQPAVDRKYQKTANEEMRIKCEPGMPTQVIISGSLDDINAQLDIKDDGRSPKGIIGHEVILTNSFVAKEEPMSADEDSPSYDPLAGSITSENEMEKKKMMLRSDDPNFGNIIQRLSQQVEEEEFDSEDEFNSVDSCCERVTPRKKVRSSVLSECESTESGSSIRPSVSSSAVPGCFSDVDVVERVGDDSVQSAKDNISRQCGSSCSSAEGKEDSDPIDDEDGSSSEIEDDSSLAQDEVGGNVASSGTAIDEEIVYNSKSGMKWMSKEPERSRQHNTSKFELPGPSRMALIVLPAEPFELDVWKQLIDEQMVEDIFKYTQARIADSRAKARQSNEMHYSDTTIHEVNAFIGLLLLTSIYKSDYESTKSLFDTGCTARPIFRTIMSYRRFTVLKEALRFDDTKTRIEREKTDPAARITEIFSKFMKNCLRMYVPGEYCTVDESLLPFRGHVKFRVYMPNKPGKYGIKLMKLVDARTGYCFNAYIYTGEGSDGKNLTDNEKKLLVPTQALLEISKPIQNSNRNITADSRFSSMETVLELRRRKLTYVGAMKNKRELPPEFTALKNRPNDELYGFSEDGNAMLYSCKTKSEVLNIISSMHNSIGERENGKSELEEFYHITMGGVHASDFKCALYSTQNRNEKWPLCVFSGMLDIAIVNSFIIHKSFEKSAAETRFKFIEKLALQLIEPHLRNRLVDPKIDLDAKMWIKNILYIEEPGALNGAPTPNTNDKLEKRKYCSLCDYKKHRYTNHKCVRCSIPICLECSRKCCVNCIHALR